MGTVGEFGSESDTLLVVLLKIEFGNPMLVVTAVEVKRQLVRSCLGGKRFPELVVGRALPRRVTGIVWVEFVGMYDLRRAGLDADGLVIYFLVPLCDFEVDTTLIRREVSEEQKRQTGFRVTLKQVRTTSQPGYCCATSDM